MAAETIKGSCLWVKDGDTFVLRSGDKVYDIRLFGVDAPEKKQPGGKDAEMFLVRLIGRKQVKVEVTGKDHGRLVGKVYYGKIYINHELVELGHAWHDKRYAPKDKDLAAAQSKAKDHKRGLWLDPAPVPPWEWRKGDHK